MGRRRNRGRNNRSRAASRRGAADTAKPGTRPGAKGKKSLAKVLGPKAQKAAKKAAKLSKGGDHAGAARIYRTIGDKLVEENKPVIASRAYLRCARSLHNAGRKEGASKAFDAALEQATASPRRKEAMVHFRDLVRRLRRNGNDEAAERMASRIKEAMGRKRLGRKRRGAGDS